MRGRKRRGVSVGTIVMLLFTGAVVVSLCLIMPKLSSNVDVRIDTDKVLQAFSFDGMPELSLNDIPISITAKETPLPTLRPVVTAQTAAQTTARPAAMVTAVPTVTPVPGGSFTLTFGGAVRVDSGLRQEHYFNEAKAYDFTDVLMPIRDELTGDLTMLTLENMIWPAEKVSDTNAPAEVLEMLSGVGVDALAAGYRNAYDQGMEGLASTIAEVKKQRMIPVGAYAQAADAAPAQLIMELGGVKVGILHYTDVLSDKGKKAVKRDGNAFAVPVDAVADGADAVLADVQTMRQQGADVVVVSLSWGAGSGKVTPTKKQMVYAQQIADAGADMIVGSGSGALQPITWLTGKLADGSTRQVLCAYSLGSLINGGRDNADVTGALLHVQVDFDGKTVSLRDVCYTPTYIWRFKQDGRYYYRVVDSSAAAPDGMSESQTESMERAFKNAQKWLGDSTLPREVK